MSSLKNKYDNEYYAWYNKLTLSQKQDVGKDKVRMDAHWETEEKKKENAEKRAEQGFPRIVNSYVRPPYDSRQRLGGSKKKSKKSNKSKKSKKVNKSKKAKK
jgi:hypothetical protein